MLVAFNVDGLTAPQWLLPLLRALVDVDRAYLRSHPSTPLLYESGVRYQAEPIGVEEWQAIPSLLRRGHGDCEDLAAWRVAELQHRGVRAEIEVQQQPSPIPGVSAWHILVRHPGGRLEDPSRRLGMPDGEFA